MGIGGVGIGGVGSGDRPSVHPVCVCRVGIARACRRRIVRACIVRACVCRACMTLINTTRDRTHARPHAHTSTHSTLLHIHIDSPRHPGCCTYIQAHSIQALSASRPEPEGTENRLSQVKARAYAC